MCGQYGDVHQILGPRDYLFVSGKHEDRESSHRFVLLGISTLLNVAQRNGSSMMNLLVAAGTHSDEVCVHIISELAPPHNMMNLELTQ